MAPREPAIQDDFHAESFEVDVPALNERFKKGDAALNGNVEDIRVQELKNQCSCLVVGPLANPGDKVNPFFVFEFLCRHALGYIEKLLRDEALKLTERLPLKDVRDLFPLSSYALSENELPELLKERSRRFQNLAFPFFLPLDIGQSR